MVTLDILKLALKDDNFLKELTVLERQPLVLRRYLCKLRLVLDQIFNLFQSPVQQSGLRLTHLWL